MNRKYLPTVADLIDSLTINHIKALKFLDKKRAYEKEMSNICHDIDLILKQKNISITDTFVRTIVRIAQLNLFIWDLKDKMHSANPKQYTQYLTLAHKLNGERNTMKNKISQIVGETDPTKKRTNVD